MLSGWGGVSEKGSLAKERNSYTFLSNLVRTTLACFLLRAPHEVCNTHQKEKTDRVGEKLAKSPGQECFVANLLCWCRRKPHLPVEFSLLPGFFSCFLSQSPTSCPAPSTAPDSLDESWVSPRTWRFTPHSPSAIVQASSSPSSSFQESLLNSLTHSLSHTPILHHSLFKNECLQFYRSGRGEAAVSSCADLAFPPHTQQPGVWPGCLPG